MPRRRFSAGLVFLIALAGCGGSTGDRAGGSRDTRPVVLTFAKGDASLPSFGEAVDRLADGALRIRFSSPGRKLPVDYEAGIIDDVSAGRADLGWVGSRAL